MQTADSTARTQRPSPEAIRHALERLAKGGPARASGFYTVVDEFAGLERLDRTDLDETDEG
jgi:hypothetical protein